ncbi:MAG: YdiU family protein [Cocleimonas sp.]|nr:YdiU family protein [Cocleimonas sp.]
MKIPFQNSYVHLGKEFYVKTLPTPVARPELIHFNTAFATALGLDVSTFDPAKATAIFSGNTLPKGAEPLAMAYAGSQFGGFNPQLGDGRAVLLGEIITPNGIRYDLQLKGAGATAFSRNGDGRSALGPVIREYLISEAMAQLGVPTTRALAMVTTGEEVARMQLVAGGILTRLSTSLVRVGTFQYFAARGDEVSIKRLADYVIQRNYPEVQSADNPYYALLVAVINRQAALIAKWMQLGFIHGVMNTDNSSIAGETIDYGPCAFMDTFNEDQVYSSIDHAHRYAYNNQAAIGQWNLIRFAETLLPLLAKGDDQYAAQQAVNLAQDALTAYNTQYHQYWLTGMRAKLGLVLEKAQDQDLIEALLKTMMENKVDFTLSFYYLSQLTKKPSTADQSMRLLFNDAKAFDRWVTQWRTRLSAETLSDTDRQKKMNAVNPVYIPRNHQVEAAIRAAEDHNDFSVFEQLNEVLKTPFVLQQGKDHYRLPPKPEEIVHQTFCGT